MLGKELAKKLLDQYSDSEVLLASDEEGNSTYTLDNVFYSINNYVILYPEEEVYLD